LKTRGFTTQSDKGQPELRLFTYLSINLYAASSTNRQ